MSTYGGIVIVIRFVTVIISMLYLLFITDTHIIINAVNLSLVVSVRRRAVFAVPGSSRLHSFVDFVHGVVAPRCTT